MDAAEIRDKFNPLVYSAPFKDVLSQNGVAELVAHFWPAIEQHVREQVAQEIEPPSRFHSTPLQVEEFLREHFAEDVLWGYQRAVGGRAVEEAAREVRSDTNLRQLEGQTGLASYGRELADLIDPLKGAGYFPSEFVSFRPKQADQ